MSLTVSFECLWRSSHNNTFAFFLFAFSQVFSRVSVYDPVFTEDDRELIEEMQMTVLSEQSARLLLSVVRG